MQAAALPRIPDVARARSRAAARVQPAPAHRQRRAAGRSRCAPAEAADATPRPGPSALPRRAAALQPEATRVHPRAATVRPRAAAPNPPWVGQCRAWLVNRCSAARNAHSRPPPAADWSAAPAAPKPVGSRRRHRRSRWVAKARHPRRSCVRAPHPGSTEPPPQKGCWLSQLASGAARACAKRLDRRPRPQGAPRPAGAAAPQPHRGSPTTDRPQRAPRRPCSSRGDRRSSWGREPELSKQGERRLHSALSRESP